MKSVSTILALLAMPLVAQQGPKKAWQDFTRTQDSGWTVEWNPATGTPAAIFGPGLKLRRGEIGTLADARRESTALLQRFHSLLGRGESTFVENIGVKANQVYIFVYDQEYKGLTVISGRADVRIHEVGTVALFGSSAVHVPKDFVTTAKLPAVDARAIARRHVFGASAAPAGEATADLVIWADTTSPRPTRATLAWEVQIDERPRETVVGKVYVDAANGNVLQFKNEVFNANHVFSSASNHTASRTADITAPRTTETVTRVAGSIPVNVTGTVMGWVNKGHLPTAALTNVPMPNLLVSVSGGNSGYTDSAGKFNIAHSGSTAVTVTATLTGRHSRRVRVVQGTQMTASRTITPGTAGTLQFGASNMGQFDRAQTTCYWFTDDVNVWLRGLLPGSSAQIARMSAVNPRVNIASSCNAYYTNFTINFYARSTTCANTAFETVIQHEWGHGIDHAFGGISQIDGLSEGWGDLICIYRSRQPEVGPGFRNGSTVGIRRGTNTRTYPAGGGVHRQGETWMGWAWDVRKNLMATLGASAGEARAHAIVVASIAADAINQPNAVREVFILDDDDGNLNNGTPNYLDLEKASLKRRLPYPKRNPAEISTFGTSCPSGSQGNAVCSTSNWTQKLAGTTTKANRVGVYIPSGLMKNLSGLDLYAQAPLAATAVTVTVHELDAVTVQPGTKILTTGKVTVGKTAGSYRVLFNPQLLIPFPRNLIFVFDNADKLVLPMSASGTSVLHWEFTTQWSAPKFDKWQFRLICDNGFRSPVQSTPSRPVIGTTFRANLSNAPNNRASVFVLGLSNTIWNGVALPWSYAAPCKLYTSLDVMIFQTTDVNGGASVSLVIPNQRSLVGGTFYTQYIVADPSRGLGLISTNGLKGKIGEH